MIGSLLKAMGDIELRGKNLWIAGITILLLGAAGNAAYDLLAHLPTLRYLGTGSIDWRTIVVDLTLLAMPVLWVWGWYQYWRKKSLRSKPEMDISTTAVKPCKALVLAMSLPLRQKPGSQQREPVPPPEINEKIVGTDEVNEIYAITSFGQLCQAINYHKGRIEFVGPLVTLGSSPWFPLTGPGGSGGFSISRHPSI